MLTITILNDRTGTDPLANYTYLVRCGSKVIGSGRITDHNRADGWKALALKAVAPGMLEACEEMLKHAEVLDECEMPTRVLYQARTIIAKVKEDK